MEKQKVKLHLFTDDFGYWTIVCPVDEGGGSTLVLTVQLAPWEKEIEPQIDWWATSDIETYLDDWEGRVERENLTFLIRYGGTAQQVLKVALDKMQEECEKDIEDCKQRIKKYERVKEAL